MQIDVKLYNAEIHDKFKALTIHQPYADSLVCPTYEIGGVPFADRQIELRNRRTSYRGDLLITSSKAPIVPGHESGVTVGIVELYEVKPARDLAETEWMLTGVDNRERYMEWYAWMTRNPRRVVEMPVNGQRGIYDLVMPKNDITEYPTALTFDELDYEKIADLIK